MSFIDIHGHYAWNIDDGIPSYEDARKALELARENRISAIVATPHVTPGVHTKDDIHDFIQRIDDLRILATEYNIDILDGCELFLNHDYQKALDQNLFIPIENTQYVLVEFDVRKEIGNEQEVEEGKTTITVYQNEGKLNKIEIQINDQVKVEFSKDSGDDNLEYNVKITTNINNENAEVDLKITYEGLQALEDVKQ